MPGEESVENQHECGELRRYSGGRDPVGGQGPGAGGRNAAREGNYETKPIRGRGRGRRGKNRGTKPIGDLGCWKGEGTQGGRGPESGARGKLRNEANSWVMARKAEKSGGTKPIGDFGWCASGDVSPSPV